MINTFLNKFISGCKVDKFDYSIYIMYVKINNLPIYYKYHNIVDLNYHNIISRIRYNDYNVNIYI